MPRVYFDTNIYSNLKGSTDNKYRELDDLLQQYKSVLSIYFSYGLIRDKRKDLTDKKFEDLKYIETWTGDNYIAYHPVEKRTSFYLATPTMVFNDNPEDDMNGLLNFFEPAEDDDEMIKAIKAIPRALFGNFSIPLDKTALNSVPEEQQRVLKELMPYDEDHPTLFHVMENMAEFTRKIFADSTLYKELRNMLYDGINGGKLILNNELDFNEALKDTVVQKSFLDFVGDHLKREGKDGVPYYDFFLMAYSMLDMLGIKKDKLSAKNTLNNIHSDGIHSYFASFCDYFVTDDTTVALKSKALYKMLGIATKVITVEEFIAILPEYAPDFEDFDLFTYKLVTDLQHAERIHPDVIGDKTIYRLSQNHRYLTFFDALLEVKGPLTNELIFFKGESTQLSDPSYSEQVKIIKCCLYAFGEDIDKKGEFNYHDRANSQSVERTWRVGNLVLELKQYDLINKYCLIITFPLTDEVAKQNL